MSSTIEEFVKSKPYLNNDNVLDNIINYVNQNELKNFISEIHEKFNITKIISKPDNKLYVYCKNVQYYITIIIPDLAHNMINQYFVQPRLINIENNNNNLIESIKSDNFTYLKKLHGVHNIELFKGLNIGIIKLNSNDISIILDLQDYYNINVKYLSIYNDFGQKIIIKAKKKYIDKLFAINSLNKIKKCGSNNLICTNSHMFLDMKLQVTNFPNYYLQYKFKDNFNYVVINKNTKNFTINNYSLVNIQYVTESILENVLKNNPYKIKMSISGLGVSHILTGKYYFNKFKQLFSKYYVNKLIIYIDKEDTNNFVETLTNVSELTILVDNFNYVPKINTNNACTKLKIMNNKIIEPINNFEYCQIASNNYINNKNNNAIKNANN